MKRVCCTSRAALGAVLAMILSCGPNGRVLEMQDGGPSPDAGVAADAGAGTEDPGSRTAAQACAIWNDGHVENAGGGWSAGPTQCDLGVLHPQAIPDTLRRINMYRRLVGLAPVSDDPDVHQGQQECAVMMRANSQLNHAPPSSWSCYTAAGAAAAGSSNLARGSLTPARAIDLYMTDAQTPSLGHRRWVLNFTLGKVGVGFAGSAECLRVFDRSGSSNRTWTAWPNPGPTPVEATRALWSFHFTGSVTGATVEVTRVSDGTPLAVTVTIPPRGYGPNTVAFAPSGWTPAVGERYRVTVSGLVGGPFIYEVSVVSC